MPIQAGMKELGEEGTLCPFFCLFLRERIVADESLALKADNTKECRLPKLTSFENHN
jgi:hypothetical protein